jgi:hypothetical protein
MGKRTQRKSERQRELKFRRMIAEMSAWKNKLQDDGRKEEKRKDERDRRALGNGASEPPIEK